LPRLTSGSKPNARRNRVKKTLGASEARALVKEGIVGLEKGARKSERRQT
jgi:hypothetical protein